MSAPVKADYSLVPMSKRDNQRYVLSRINLPSIEITREMKLFIERSMDEGKKFVKIGDFTIMVNAIAGIDPVPKSPYKRFNPADWDERGRYIGED